jgi:MHS family proline/betaine transporter-like MFS transporter
MNEAQSQGGTERPTVAKDDHDDVLGAMHWRLIIAATIGNVLEWYDFFTYGVLAITMAKLFFPTGNELTSLLLSLVTYGGGLAMRPVGAIVLGRYGDRVGRKASLSLSMSIMGVGTALIVFTPTYETIGITAPLLIALGRLVQGFSGAGEIGGSIALLVENAPDRRRGLYASLNAAAHQFGFLLAAFIAMLLTITMSQAQIEAGGWRLPFALGLVIMPFAIYIRTKLPEPELFLRARYGPAKAKKVAMRHQGRPLLLAFGLLMLYVIAGNVLFVYMPTFAVHELRLSSSGALFATVVGTCTMIICTPLLAVVSDRFGRKPLFLISIVGYLLLSYPAFVIVARWPSVMLIVAVQSGFALLNAIYVGPLMSALAELFPTRVRATGISLAYGLAAMIGALSPSLGTWLIAATGDVRAPAFTVIGACFISGFALFLFKDRYREPLL